MSEKKNRANIHMLGAIGFVAVATPGVAASMFIPNRVASSLVALVWGVIAFLVVQWVISRRAAEKPKWSTPESRRRESVSENDTLDKLSPRERGGEQFTTGERITSYQPLNLKAPSIDDLLGTPEPAPESAHTPAAVPTSASSDATPPHPVDFASEPASDLASEPMQMASPHMTQPLDVDAIISEAPLEPRRASSSDVREHDRFGGEALLEDPVLAAPEKSERPEMATEKLDLADFREFDSGSVLVPMDEVAFADTQDEIEAVTAPSPQPELVMEERRAALATRPFHTPANQIAPTQPVDMQDFSKKLARESEARAAADEATLQVQAPVDQRSTQQIEDMPALLSSLLGDAKSEDRSEGRDVEFYEGEGFEDEDATSRLENVASLMSQMELEIDADTSERQHPTTQVDWNELGGLPDV